MTRKTTTGLADNVSRLVEIADKLRPAPEGMRPDEKDAWADELDYIWLQMSLDEKVEAVRKKTGKGKGNK